VATLGFFFFAALCFFLLTTLCIAAASAVAAAGVAAAASCLPAWLPAAVAVVGVVLRWEKGRLVPASEPWTAWRLRGGAAAG
jgi:hypothetical protein